MRTESDTLYSVLGVQYIVQLYYDGGTIVVLEYNVPGTQQSIVHYYYQVHCTVQGVLGGVQCAMCNTRSRASTIHL